MFSLAQHDMFNSKCSLIKSYLKKLRQRFFKHNIYLSKKNNSMETSASLDAVVQTAKEINAYFIVKGTRGLGKVRVTILGSARDYILRHASMPVVVCKFAEKKGY